MKEVKITISIKYPEGNFSKNIQEMKEAIASGEFQQACAEDEVGVSVEATFEEIKP